MSKVIFDRNEAEALLERILAKTLPKGFQVLLVCDRDGEPNSWITLGDLDLSRATQVINGAMAEEWLKVQRETDVKQAQGGEGE